MVKSTKRNSIVWGICCIIGLIVYIAYINNWTIFNFLNLKDVAYAVLTACIVILPYIYCEKKTVSRIIVYIVSVSFSSLLIVDYLFIIDAIKYIIIFGFIALICFMILKYKNALPILIIEKQKLKNEASTKLLSLLNYNLFANSICIIGITGLLWDTELNSYIIIAIITVLAVLATVIRQIYSLKFYKKQRRIFILEYIFLVVFIVLTSLMTFFSKNNDKGLLQTFIYIVVFMTAYLMFDRPFFLEKLMSDEKI